MKDKKIGTVIKTESKVIAYVVICLVIIVLGISYALFFEVKGNEKNQIVKAGTLEFTYEKGSQITNDTNSDCFIPMNEEEALKHSECEYKISITNAGTLPGNYNIKLNSETVEKPLDLNKLKIILKKEGEIVDGYPKEGTTTSLVENEKIEAGSVINYTIQVYVDNDNELLNADDDEKNISLKINGDAVVNSEDVNPINKSLAINYVKNIATVESGDGLYEVKHNNLEELGQEWNKTEYRYAGVNPNNYVKYNNELWRIIGLVNVKTASGVEQRVKIVRADGIEGQKDFGSFAWDKTTGYTNNWTTSKLKDMLNGIYYESGTGDCYKGTDGNVSSQNTCNFISGVDLPKGLDDTAKQMIDTDVIWNIGGWNTSEISVNQIYEKERGKNTGNNNSYPTEWSKQTNVGEKFNGIGLMYPSDYGYATGGNIRNTCLEKNLNNYNTDDCNTNDWIRPSGRFLWTLSPLTPSSHSSFSIYVYTYVANSYIDGALGVWPTIYLKESIQILPNKNTNIEYGSKDNPFILSGS